MDEIIFAFDNDLSKIEGSAWHYHQETGRMQLVGKVINNEGKYIGGNSLQGKGGVTYIDD